MIFSIPLSHTCSMGIKLEWVLLMTPLIKYLKENDNREEPWTKNIHRFPGKYQPPNKEKKIVKILTTCFIALIFSLTAIWTSVAFSIFDYARAIVTSEFVILAFCWGNNKNFCEKIGKIKDYIVLQKFKMFHFSHKHWWFSEFYLKFDTHIRNLWTTPKDNIQWKMVILYGNISAFWVTTR